MSVKIDLRLTFEEFSTIDSGGKDYSCRVTAIYNGQENTHVYDNAIEALEAGRRVTAEWLHTFVKLKRNTLRTQKRLGKAKLKLIKP